MLAGEISIVRQGKAGFEIIDGFKRYHAATALGWASLEANIFQVSRRLALVEKLEPAVIVDELLKTPERDQQKYILDHPLEVLERDQDHPDGDYGARLGAAGNRLLKTIKIAYRQINRLSDETERSALDAFTALEWMTLEPELVRVSRRAHQLADFIEQIVHRRNP